MRRLRILARTLALPTLAGVLYFLSWVGFGIWPLAFICFVPFLWAIRDDTPEQALKKGLWFGLVTHMGGYTWIIHLLQVFAFFPLPVAFLGYVAVCAFQGAILGVFAYALRWAQLKCAWRLVVLVPVALCAVEWVYPLLFQSYTGVALYPALAVVQIADLGGVLMLSALQGAVNGALADMLLWWAAKANAKANANANANANAKADVGRIASPLFSLTLAAALCAASATYGFVRLRQLDSLQKAAPQRKIGIAQPNVGELELHQNPQASVRTLWDQTAELHSRGAELVVWPEAGFNLRGIDLALPEAAEWMRRGTPVSLIAGAARIEPLYAGPHRYNLWNSAILVDKNGRFAGHFDKISLLAFGEYIPFGDIFPILYRWSPMSSPFSRGTTLAPLVDGGFRYATFICYEDILPALVRSLMAKTKDGRPHAMVNLTNDSWYGVGHEQEQHLILAAIRSIEHRRWLIRATSTGVSAFVDATGRVVQRIGRNERGVAARDVPMLEGTTLYQLLGAWPGYLSVLTLLALGLSCARERWRQAALQRGAQ